ncbi:MAG: lysine--tRNA ligase, partial [Candidatus Eisenbacteria bacterium]|nr:lysine--tRNA ligase [Candidatus Eisenbacteria bacterium]
VSMLDAVGEATGESVADLDPGRLLRLAGAHGIVRRPGTGPGVLLDALFSELVQPSLQAPTLVVDYPSETSPLARASRTRTGVVERFEVFVAGMEIANAFSEQNDPEAQRAAFEAQMQLRAAGDDEAQVMDADYVRALEYGMPPTGGVGIGIDRLVMLVTDARSIRDVVLFPQLRPEEGRGDASEGDSEDAPDGSAGESAVDSPERPAR